MSPSDQKLILLVEDAPNGASFIANLLADLFRVEHATNATSALASANGAEKPDLILLDMMTPAMAGPEVCRTLKENPDTRDIPIIFLTEENGGFDEVKGFELGATDYLYKPYPAPVVLARVKAQLALQEALTQAREGLSDQGFVSSPALAEVLSSINPITLEPEEVLIHQGASSDAAFFLDDGSMQVYAETRHGSVTLATVQAPRLIGEIGALAGLARTASVKALTPARLFRINRAQLFKLSRKSPDLLMAVVRQLGQQINSVSKAVALYTNALTALEKREFDKDILDELEHPSPELAEFSAAFRRLAHQILTKQLQLEEMASATLIQGSFLPRQSAVHVKDVEICSKIRPARDVGGDFYDFFQLDAGRLAIVIGDVCGKGIPASIFMAVVVTVLRLAAREEQDAASTMARTNAILCRDNASSLFATAFYGVLDLKSGALDYCNCGHNAPVHIPASGEPRRLAATGLPLALFADRPAASARTQINPGDDLILFTDGVTEAINPQLEEFGDPLLVETLASRNLPTAELVSQLFAAVERFADGEEQADDMACVAIRRRLDATGDGS